jgi:hypothetical protein
VRGVKQSAREPHCMPPGPDREGARGLKAGSEKGGRQWSFLVSSRQGKVGSQEKGDSHL